MFETSLFILAGIPCATLFGLAAYMAAKRHYLHRGYSPVVDYDALQAELDAEFGPLPIDKAARLSA
jgi:hypothetical protein